MAQQSSGSEYTTIDNPENVRVAVPAKFTPGDQQPDTDAQIRRWRCSFIPHKINAQGRQHIAVGARIGYWPCLNAWYIQASIFRWRIEVWYGPASYWRAGDDGPTLAQSVPTNET